MLKKLAQQCGVYVPARHLYRLIFKPQVLAEIKEETRFYSQFIGPGDLCFDVGANNGDKTEIFLAAGANVVAFEPQLVCLRDLRSRYSGSKRVKIVPEALGAEKGEAKLWVHEHDAPDVMASFNQDWYQGNTKSYMVPVRTLDDAIKEFGMPKYCKIDVEGFEPQVIKGLSQPIPIVSFEYHLGRKTEGEIVDVTGEAGKAETCLRHLMALGGRIEVNLSNTAHFRARSLRFEKWISVDELLKFFDAQMKDPNLKRDDASGDIYVRMV